MIRDTKDLTKTSKVLLYLLATKEAVAPIFAYPTLQKALYPEYAKYKANKRLDATIYRLRKQGWIKVEYKESKRLLSLTNHGEIEALMQKARIDKLSASWDNKWRLIMFDIPEEARVVRNKLRKLLKDFGFYALQASVYVYPFALAGSAIEVLKRSGLMRYIRIARIDSFDDDKDLKKYFKNILPKSDGRQY